MSWDLLGSGGGERVGREDPLREQVAGQGGGHPAGWWGTAQCGEARPLGRWGVGLRLVQPG